MNYFEHNDQRGRTQRLRVQSWNAERARMLAAQREQDIGTVTLCMSARSIRAALGRTNYGSK